ncbi:MAG: bacillithiol biosynthesis deacetylase BshB1 [Longimicrobiales bacterium]|nr:bacillithiol biosynthesis deacetylase BshB1 [Longimicrobiales bacterium]
MIDPLDVLAVMAHPDDAELLCGGSLIRSSDAGERTGILDLTRGEMGTRGTVEVRAREAEHAAEILGLAERRNAGLPDGAIENSVEARRIVAAVLRELRPRVVVTHWREGRHPDHRVAAQLAWDASFLAGLTNLEIDGSPHRPEKFVYATAFRESADPPTFVVDVTDQMERKFAAIQAYASQFEGIRQGGEIYPGGDRPFLDQVRVVMARDGSRIRVAFGEPFRTRETLAWPTLGTLPVASF